MSTAKLTATGHKRVASLADFDFCIKYRPGKANKDADFLSRMPPDINSFISKCTEEISSGDIKASITATFAQNVGSSAWITSLTLNKTTVDSLFAHPTTRKYWPMKADVIRKAQVENAVLDRLIYIKENGKPTQDRLRSETLAAPTTMHEWSKFKIEPDGIIYRKAMDKGILDNNKLVLPQRYHRLMLRHLHEEMGHVGANRVIELARERFYLPHMARDIEHYVTKVCECLK